MTTPAELVLDEHGLDEVAFGFSKDAGVGAFIFPGDLQNPSETSLMIFLQLFKMSGIYSPRFAGIE